jgi:hypothetical protein
LSSLIPYGDGHAAYTDGVLFVVGTIADVANGLETAVKSGLVGQRVLRKTFQLDIIKEMLDGGVVEVGEQHFAHTGGMGRQATADC